ncbi:MULTISPECIES: tRNA (adenosine(37)-N6)-threonylcarbamoyltransferase complex dimerization subunit type 1 TsaB [Paenibacillus]|uniref:tRNA N6-adenosine(37)-N6-threonylcarbamoyltransferase complex dimerization subunit TsaB n=1 Tax=Paenibacillus polymyxa TaxID=1406 RepID=A0ABX2ZNM2_PAEPO|nr:MULTISPECIES: tRNA (adenosine(37)-N6)-threonylcarbamoyltransferase complex dimerization subunit type 1 TsaB [Paenibacillus]ALA41140.1 peptidase M22 [Paenibacillus peoriae]ODA10555.1 tRNA N6-adenosine(37)-N6-threonylcarbamoyltransferase complex dimerization subunit TsaB [Paenibacillus polymyxa]ODB58031.1 tRNA N6-adenosine(37)-N6-threonylcarbamoyltransferase complex dimerization subunit TsaB [Paenibacillus polymyxa]OME70139.1 tRNA (adenosine(37)-N6)-threonylcarbamoyltransferase complex dimeriz
MQREHTDVNVKPRERFLTLDTATTVMAAALMNGRELLGESNVYGERNHSVHVISELERLLNEEGLTRDDVDGIAVGVGPGSYTGIRIAVTAAKTLAWAWGVPVTSISTLHALAWGGWNRGIEMKGQEGKNESVNNGSSGAQAADWIVPVLDARRGQVYTGLFAVSTVDDVESPQRLEPDAIRLMTAWTDDLLQRLESLPSEERPPVIWLVGETAVHAETAERLRAWSELRSVPYELEGRWVGRLGADKLLRQEHDELHTLVPNYTQLAEAEANLLRQR